ncbi:hypothetical protein WJX84_001001 [Apatococcus fuscideae]|uniref:RING-type domain-containing protein n=1 Tax=Apatococcus fuscideae TaxID=2026836 RepID=A0AAW1SM17_9CHLO
MARGKGGAKIHGQERPNTLTEKERQICPLCIEPLDPTEKNFFPCPCGYQVCLFCFRRLKEEFSNQCPGCRTVYGSDFDPGRRLRNEVKRERPNHAADYNPGPLPQAAQPPMSPAGPVISPPQPQKLMEPISKTELPRPELPPVRAASPLAPIATRNSHLQGEGNGQTPQQQQPSALLQMSQGASVTPDPDGAALLASTQQRVANGGLSVREAARLLVSFLRAKQAAADSAAHQSSFYSGGMPGSMNGGGILASPPRHPAAPNGKSTGFWDGFPDSRSHPAGGPSVGLQGSGGADGGLLSSLLGDSRGMPAPSRATANGISWQQQQQQPDDDLMRLLWGSNGRPQVPRQSSWTHVSQPTGHDAQMEGHVPLYARARNGKQPDASASKGWEQADRAHEVHGQNGFTSHPSWRSSASMSSELAAIALSAPPQ